MIFPGLFAVGVIFSGDLVIMTGGCIRCSGTGIFLRRSGGLFWKCWKLWLKSITELFGLDRTSDTNL